MSASPLPLVRSRSKLLRAQSLHRTPPLRGNGFKYHPTARIEERPHGSLHNSGGRRGIRTLGTYCYAHTLSKRASSATRASFRVNNNTGYHELLTERDIGFASSLRSSQSKYKHFLYFKGSFIEPLKRFAPLTPFPRVLLQPLGHLSSSGNYT